MEMCERCRRICEDRIALEAIADFLETLDKVLQGTGKEKGLSKVVQALRRIAKEG
ncbi:hypothetical protein LCGC14_2096790 [marine sediment metagenome]|uniref:Uncharacterized protein n=1 Tax=marine sediment metagenome TaxID=412755 RepID=A0A0F9EBD4_9ZZZZ